MKERNNFWKVFIAIWNDEIIQKAYKILRFKMEKIK